MSEFLDWLAAQAQSRDRAGLRRATTPFKADEVLDLAGNDYLGLRRHPAVVAGAVAAAETYGGGAGASRLVTGTLPIHEHLEQALCDLTAAPSALVFSTGYHANLGALTALADADTLIVSDAHAHASLIDGARLSRGTVVVSRHNDLGHVRELLAHRTQRRAVVVVESIYSVFGDAAPLAELSSLALEFDAVLLVDDAHGLGVLGARGEGGPAHAGITTCDHVVVTATLSKSLAAQGGVVLGHRSVRQHLVNTSRPFIYDTGLAPAAAGAALGALEVLGADPRLPERARANAAALAAACGVAAPAGAVLSVAMPGPAHALAAVAEAEARGIRIGCFRPPSTPDGTSRLRLTAHANHTRHDLDRAAAVLESLVPRA
ncbi:8-amino-7-oxononanoate synthase [Nostocoides sp. HKS02]|uniref:8-amino-7-oxononanoate synthase n=1 Tax=Nostocoides sp. HKS02 TaxID=1813880 RepID=UPI0012B483E7|nr:8-amino-7-oxononanoate synthase [Tetrasphaera sp. HKS02]QGN57464.1 aminotransferase class I/II-fold pyridoxal phosphate-dependent enzyme [Tetrasphaera sp. HKS02]